MVIHYVPCIWSRAAKAELLQAPSILLDDRSADVCKLSTHNLWYPLTIIKRHEFHRE